MKKKENKKEDRSRKITLAKLLDLQYKVRDIAEEIDRLTHHVANQPIFLQSPNFFLGRKRRNLVKTNTRRRRK